MLVPVLAYTGSGAMHARASVDIHWQWRYACSCQCWHTRAVALCMLVPVLAYTGALCMLVPVLAYTGSGAMHARPSVGIHGQWSMPARGCVGLKRDIL